MARIMVVEDDVYMREELTDLLRKSGYETVALKQSRLEQRWY